MHLSVPPRESPSAQSQLGCRNINRRSNCGSVRKEQTSRYSLYDVYKNSSLHIIGYTQHETMSAGRARRININLHISYSWLQLRVRRKTTTCHVPHTQKSKHPNFRLMVTTIPLRSDLHSCSDNGIYLLCLVSLARTSRSLSTMCCTFPVISN